MYLVMSSIDVSVPDLAEKWFSRFFIGSAPYQLCLRVFDIFMYEGSTVLFRVGLAILATFAEPLSQCNTKEDFYQCLELCLSSTTDPSDIIKVYFVRGSREWRALAIDSRTLGAQMACSQFKIKHKHLYQRLLAYQQIMTEIPSRSMEILHIPRIQCSSDIINTEQFESLWCWLPERWRLKSPKLLFTTATDGCNINTLFLKCEDIAPTILLIKAADGSVRRRHAWPHCTGKFLNHEACVVFAEIRSVRGTSVVSQRKVLRQRRDVPVRAESARASVSMAIRQPVLLSTRQRLVDGYRWRQRVRTAVASIDQRMVAWKEWHHSPTLLPSSSEGLWLDNELWHGRSTKCATFNNEPLHAGGPSFECVVVEVYGLADV